MISSFSGISTLLSSLRVQSLAQQIAGHNIANANTRGYSRQVARLWSLAPLSLPGVHSVYGPAQIGAGVGVSSLARIRDEFLDLQLRFELSMQGERGGILEAMRSLSVIFPELNDPAGAGLMTALGALFTEFGALAAAPGDAAARSSAVQAAQTLAAFFNDASRTLAQLQNTTDARVRDSLVRANGLLERIAAANENIARVTASGGAPNDLMDQRDLALDELSSLIKIDVVKMADGTVTVMTGNARTLVRGDRAAALVALPGGHEPRFANVGLRDANTGTVTDITGEIRGGAIAGQLTARDTIVAGQLLRLDELASSLIRQANKLHSGGYALDGTTTGLALFAGTEARDIAVNPAVAANPSLLAASSVYGDPSDGAIAESISLLGDMIMNATVESLGGINNGAMGMIDPTVALNSAVTTALNVTNSNSLNFLVAPAAAGTIVINGVSVNWTIADSVDDIVARINDPLLGLGVRAAFDYTQQRLIVLSDRPLSVSDSAGNLTDVLRLETSLISLAPMNNGVGAADRAIDPLAALAASSLEYRTQPASQGIITINGANIAWDSSQSLSAILANINAAINPLGLDAAFSAATQEVTIRGTGLLAAITPVSVIDTEGNLSEVLNIQAHPSFVSFRDGLLAQAQAQLDQSQSLSDQSEAAVRQLELQRAAIMQVSVDEEQVRILEYLRAYEAAVRAIAALDEALNTLINRMAVSSWSGTGSTFSS